jgi:hypothetical protein
MNKSITCFVVAIALTGCGVSPEHQKALADLQVSCNAGNADACVAAGYQSQANQQEAQANQAAVANVGAALLAGAAAGAVIANQPAVYVQPVYVVPSYRHWYH